MKRVIALCFIVVVCATMAAFGAPSPTPTPQTAVLNPADFQSALNQRVADQPGVGIIVGIIDRGRLSVYKAGSTGTTRPLDAHTLFEIGSVTKTFTATILASMALDESVALDDPVAKYLPKRVIVPSRNGKQITLLNLATQHSGLPRLPDNLRASDPEDPYANYSLDDLYAFLKSYTLTRDPGQTFEYSNLGVALLGDALASRAGVPYLQLLRDRILAPLQMTETSTTVAPALQQQLAAGHDADGSPTEPWTFQAIAPAGAIRSSLADMLKYLRCNMGEGPLADTCLFAQQPRDTFTGNQIGLVWWTDDATHIINHGGDTGGYHAWVAVSQDRSEGAVVLTNGGVPVQDVALHAIDPSVPLSEPERVANLDTATLDEYVGIYKARQENLTFTVSRVGDRLEAQLTGQPFANIYPSSQDHFFYRVVNAQIDFTRSTNGKVNAFVLHQNGATIVAVRPGMRAPPIQQPAFPPIVALDAQTLGGYVGTYTAGQGLQFVVTLQGNQLMVQLTGQPSFPVYSSAKDKFYYKIVNAQIDFERDANGDVTDLILHQNGQEIKALKG